MKSEMTGIEIRDLHLSFGETRVLTGVNLDISPGEFFAFLGPSGSGKSTLLRAIAGFGPRPQGEILLGGRDIADLPPWKRDVGMVFQSYALWPHLSVRDNVAFGLRERKVPGKEVKRRVGEALELVGLSHLIDRMPNQLSGGQQQRIALARTVVIEPRVLLLDEPLSNLDAGLRVQMRRELLSLQRKLGLTTIFVTHDQEEANTTADRMAVLDGGVIQQIGSPQDLYDQPANLFVARFLGTANILDGRIDGQGDDLHFVSCTGDRIALGGHVSATGAGSMVLRPQNIELSDRQSATSLSGQVTHCEFLGGQIRYLIDCAGTEIVVDQPHRAGEFLRPVESRVYLDMNTSNAVFLAG